MIPTVRRFLNAFTVTGTVLCTVGMVLSVLLQALARWLLPSAPAWTEEVSRFCFVFAVAFGAGPALQDGLFVHVDSLPRLLPFALAVWLQRLSHLVIAGLMGSVAAMSLRFMSIGVGQRSPCLGLPMQWIYGSVTLLSVTLCLYALLALFPDSPPEQSP